MDIKDDIESVLPIGLFLDEIPNVVSDDDRAFEIYCDDEISDVGFEELIRFDFTDDIKEVFGDSAEIEIVDDNYGCVNYSI